MKVSFSSITFEIPKIIEFCSDLINLNCSSNLEGSHKSSESRKDIYSPLEIFKASFLGGPGPPVHLSK